MHMNDSRHIGYVIFALLAATIGTGAAGCSNKHGVKTVPVRGVVRLESGAWPASGNISFVPLEAAAGHPLRPGWALFNQEGAFSAGCFEDGDGLVPGKYSVNIDCWDVAPQPGNAKPATNSCIPMKYQRGFQKLTVAASDSPHVVEWVIPAK